MELLVLSQRVGALVQWLEACLESQTPVWHSSFKKTKMFFPYSFVKI